MGQAGLEKEQRTPHVHVEGLGERLRRDLPDGLGHRVGRVVDQDVDTAVGIGRRGGEPVHVVEVSYVARNGQGFAAGGTDGGHGLIAGIGLAAGHHDAGSLGGESLGDRPTYAPTPTGHDHHPSGQVVECSHPVSIQHGVVPSRTVGPTVLPDRPDPRPEEWH